MQSRADLQRAPRAKSTRDAKTETEGNQGDFCPPMIPLNQALTDAAPSCRGEPCVQTEGQLHREAPTPGVFWSWSFRLRKNRGEDFQNLVVLLRAD